MKRVGIIGIVFAIILCFTACHSSGDDVETVVTGLIAGNYTYSINSSNQSVVITEYSGSDQELVIPDALNEIPVVAIDNEVFMDHKELRSISLPKKLESIGDNAFSNCSSLVQVDFKNAKKIGDGAFSNCTSLDKVVFPDSLETIGWNAFNQCAALKTITFGKNICDIGQDAFGGTPWLYAQKEAFVIVGNGILLDYNGEDVEITIPDSVCTIASAFSGNTHIQSVKIPKSVTRICSNAFQDCISLTSVSMENSVTFIGTNAFSRCSHLMKVELSKNIEVISEQAFMMCTSLKELFLPDKAKEIGFQAFYGCKDLESIYIPKAVKTIDKEAFNGCEKLLKIRYEGKEKDWKKIDFEEKEDLRETTDIEYKAKR